MSNTFYCTECEAACEETCRDCGNDDNVIEICGKCGEWLDNCTCD